MFNKKIKSRIFFLIFLIFLLVLAVYFSLKTLKENVVYFLSPAEISKKEIDIEKKIRIGGMVKKDSLTATENSISFIVTDFKNEIFVNYSVSIPNLFSEGKGVVVEGKLRDKNYFIASKILAKHDENYMPPEVNAALKDEKK